MPNTQAITSVSPQKHGTPRTAAPAGNGRDADPEGHVDLSVAFDVLLDVARLTAGFANNRGLTGAASPSQMFEPNAPDAHQRRRGTMQEQFRTESLESSRADRSDRVGVRARRDLGHGNNSGPQSALPGDATAPQRAAASAGDATLRSLFAKLDGDAAGRLGSDSHSKPNGANVTAQEHFRGEGPPGANRATRVTSSARAGAIAAGRETSGASSLRGPAGQVAKLLASGRGTEPAQVRAPTSSAGAPELSPRLATHKQPTSTRTPGQPAAGSFSRSAQASGGTFEAGNRTMFDELVRSIRLGGGARQSSARLQLQPPKLGRLTVDVRVIDDQVRITVRTETASARDLVQERAAHLTTALGQHGIHVEHFEVTSDLSGDVAGETLDRDASDRGVEDAASRVAGGRAPSPMETDSEEEVVEESGEGWHERGAAAETRLDIRI